MISTMPDSSQCTLNGESGMNGQSPFDDIGINGECKVAENISNAASSSCSETEEPKSDTVSDEVNHLADMYDKRMACSETLDNLDDEQRSSEDRLPNGGPGYDVLKGLESTETDSLSVDEKQPLSGSFDELGLPPGWRRMTGDTGVYYWHVESGEISREIPEFYHSHSHPDDMTLAFAKEMECLQLPESQSEIALMSTETKLSPLSHSSSQDLSKVVESLEMYKRDAHSLAFPVFGLGSCILTRDDLKKDSSVAISSAIWSICHDNRERINQFSGKDFLLILENETLQVCDYIDNCVLLSVPVAQIRLWGVGKDSGHDFAFVSKDRSSGAHWCYAFRSDRSAKAISAALQKTCDKIVAERASKRRSLPANPFLQPSFENKFWNDNEPTPKNNMYEKGERNPQNVTATPLDRIAQSSVSSNEDCEKFHVYYIGSMPCEKSNGIDSINEAISDLRDIGAEEYTAALVQVSPSSILITNEENGALITESRVRYLSFLGIGKDACKFGYIVSTCRNQFICHVLHCPDSAGPLAKAVESACKVRYQKVLEAKKRQLLAAPKLTRQQTMPTMMSAISKTFQDAVSGAGNRATSGGTDDATDNDANSGAQANYSQYSIKSSFSSLFGRLSRYTSSARMSRAETNGRIRPKSQLYDDVIAGSFESYNDEE